MKSKNFLKFKSRFVPKNIKVGSVAKIKPLHNKGGKKIRVKNVSNAYEKRFTRVFDFVVPFTEEHFGWMRNYAIPEKYRIKKSLKDIKIYQFEENYREMVKKNITELSEIANCHPWQDQESRFRYQERWIALAKLFTSELLTQEDNEKIRIIAPLRAGELTSWPYQILEIQVGSAVFKRLPMKNGETWIGIREIKFPKIDDDSVVVFTEGCTASGATVVAGMIYFREKAIRPKTIELHTINTPQHSMIFMLSAAQELGFDLRIKSASISYRKDKKLYNHWDTPRWHEQAYVLPDIDNYSTSLPTKYNDIAQWNIGRKKILSV